MQACGAPMNGQLFKSLQNPWLASVGSFGLIVALLVCMFAVFPRPLPTLEGINTMPWWAPLGGLIGAVAVYAGLVLVEKVGAGPYTGLTVTASLLTSIAIDQFGVFGMEVHRCGLWRALGAGLMVAGVDTHREILTLNPITLPGHESVPAPTAKHALPLQAARTVVELMRRNNVPLPHCGTQLGANKNGHGW